jgi:hypothetical protein
MRLLTPLTFVALATLAVGDRPLFSTQQPLEITLEAPLQQIFGKGAKDDKFTAKGVLSYRDSGRGSAVVIPEVAVSVRGHTSKRETECSFPKLKVEFGDKAARDASIFSDLDSIRIGTHCGENPGEELTPGFGRLANEKSPIREAFVYRLLGAMEVPTAKARPARITYVDTGAGGAPLVRSALLLEDDEEVKRRMKATGEITMEQFTNARDRFSPADTARLAFAEAMIGNFDWCLRFYPGDTYRCNAKLPLWNVAAFERRGTTALPVIADFDLAGMVVGRHRWFGKVYDVNFVPSRSSIEVEVLSQVQRTRSLFARDLLDDARRYFAERKSTAYDALASSGLDARGRELVQLHLDAFFNAIGEDAFYRPVITRPNTPAYMDAARSREACVPGDTVPPGTPVNVIVSEGEMAQVLVLDVHWRWAPPKQCEPLRVGPVWIEKTAIGTDYPAAGRQEAPLSTGDRPIAP